MKFASCPRWNLRAAGTNPLRVMEEDKDVAGYEERTVELAVDHSHGHAREGPELQGQMEWESVHYPTNYQRWPRGTESIGTQPNPGAGGGEPPQDPIAVEAGGGGLCAEGGGVASGV